MIKNINFLNGLFLLFAGAGFFCLPKQGQAQRHDVQQWTQAQVVLATGDTIFGPLAFHRNQEMIMVTQPNGSVSTLTPVNVVEFSVSGGNRIPSKVFRTYMWNRDRDYSDFKSPSFFEQISFGPYSVLRKEKYVQRDVSYNDPYGRRYNNMPMMQTYIQDVFYLLTPQHEVLPLRNPKKDILRIFSKKSKQIEAYVKENRLDYDNATDLVRIVNHYNSLAN